MNPLLEVLDLSVHIPLREGVWGKAKRVVRAVDGVSFCIAPKQTVALVGESGCGKTTVARALLGLHRPTGGSILFQGVDLTSVRSNYARLLRRDMQIVFQDPYGSLNPRMSVLGIVSEPLRAHGKGHSGLEQQVIELLELVGLSREHLWRRPHEFSGGQRQRIAIARALAVWPKLLVLDEPTSALDVSVQARILVLLSDLQKRFGLAYLLISHDLGVVRLLADHILVMYLGKIVERGSVEDIFAYPLHPYTRALLTSVPSSDPDVRGEQGMLQGGVPNAVAPPGGCRFHPRCAQATGRCAAEEPKLQEVEKDRLVACHLVSQGSSMRQESG